MEVFYNGGTPIHPKLHHFGIKTCGLGDPAYWLGAPFHSSTAGESATLPADLPLLCLHQSQCWLQGFMGCFLKDFEEGIWGINTVLRRIVS